MLFARFATLTFMCFMLNLYCVLRIHGIMISDVLEGGGDYSIQIFLRTSQIIMIDNTFFPYF